MAETFRNQDLMTLQSIARGAGIPDPEDMPHDELVDMLRRAGLAEPDGEPIDTRRAGSGRYQGRGVGRRESAGGPAAQTGAEYIAQPTRDPAQLAGLPRSDLSLGDDSTGGWAAEESVGGRRGASRIPDVAQDARSVQGEDEDPAHLAGLPRSSLNLGDETTGGRAAEEAIGARPGESDAEIDDRTQG